MRILWCAAVLGTVCLVGCEPGGPPVTPAKGAADTPKTDEPKPDAPQGDAPRPEPPRISLVGAWRTAGGEGMEFTGDGGLRIVRPDKTVVQGTYKSLDADLIEVDLPPASEAPFQLKVAGADDAVTLTAQIHKTDDFGFDKVEERASAWKRVASLDAPADDGGKEVELPGRWVADAETYDFFADGTFAHADPERLGTWKRTPGALECDYPDSGRTEKLVALASGGDLVIGTDDAKCPIALLRTAQTFRRAGDAVAERKPAQDGVLTAYQIYREYKANPEEADKKFKGKEVRIAGVVTSSLSGSLSSIVIVNGKSVVDEFTGTTLYLATGERGDVQCRIPDPKDGAGPNEITGGGEFVILQGICLGMSKEEGAFVINGDEPKVRFEKCVRVSPTKPGEKDSDKKQ